MASSSTSTPAAAVCTGGGAAAAGGGAGTAAAGAPVDLRSLLDSCGAQGYMSNFQEQGYEPGTPVAELAELTSDELKSEIGVDKLKPRKALLRTIDDWCATGGGAQRLPQVPTSSPQRGSNRGHAIISAQPLPQAPTPSPQRGSNRGPAFMSDTDTRYTIHLRLMYHQCYTDSSGNRVPHFDMEGLSRDSKVSTLLSGTKRKACFYPAKTTNGNTAHERISDVTLGAALLSDGAVVETTSNP
jgi:hypothetical protein